MTRISKLQCLLIVAAVTICSSGSIAVEPHTPDEGLVSRLGNDSAKSQLEAVLARVIDPPIQDVQVTGDDYSFGFNRGWHPYQFAPTGYNRMQMLFADVGRCEIYENHKVFVYDRNGHVPHQLESGDGS